MKTRDLLFKNGQVLLAMDEAPMGAFPTVRAALAAAALLGMDEGPNRSMDRDGRMHVKQSNISKANVCEYFGREIPGGDRLGLDPNKKYRLLRHPDELKKAASTFNNLPILAQHVPVTAEDHQPHLIIGTTGTDAAYEHPYLKNSTSFWSGGAVDAINSEAMRDLSSAYHYRPDMTPGEYEGEAYDGVMRDIVGNHVALVREGRAGDDVVVGDEKPQELYMTKKVLSRTALFAAGSVSGLLAPMLAQDAKPIDASALFEGVTAKNFKQMLPEVGKRARKALEGVKLAQDASIDDVLQLVDALEAPEVQEGVDADPETGAPMDMAAMQEAMKDPGATDEDGEEAEKKRREFLSGKLSPEDLAAYDAIGGGEAEVKPELKLEKEVKIDKPAMDAAINEAVQNERKNNQAIRAAELAVEPYVGRLAMAFDSAEGVYKQAFAILGVDVKGVHPSAFPTILGLQTKPGAKPANTPLAMDAAPSEDFTARFPGAANIRHA